MIQAQIIDLWAGHIPVIPVSLRISQAVNFLQDYRMATILFQFNTEWVAALVISELYPKMTR